MCVRIEFDPPDVPPAFDAETRTIRVPRDLDPAHTVTLVRAILHELVVPQPQLGAVCWCGAEVDLTPRVPRQRRSDQVVKHGA
ncbi:hypothetical protein GCM10010240_13770 [Streptomyces griseoviridis]|nr:hypothetical protein GCM10010240_13770 [Streptomyces griseoviridis]